MKVLVFGPSASGKTYVAKVLQAQGINAFDDGDIAGLSNWYDRNGKKVTEPASPEEASEKQYSFLWSRKFLASFLADHQDVFIFGGSGNIANVLDLFDQVYFLKIDPALQKQRLLSPDRPTPYLDFDEKGEPIIWGDWLEDLALDKGIPFVDANQSPEAIYRHISNPSTVRF
jgi:hypothetical protein